MQLPFFANAIFGASGDNLDLKCRAKSCLCSWGSEEAKALQSPQSSQRTFNLIHIITRFVDTTHLSIVMITHISQSLTFFQNIYL